MMRIQVRARPFMIKAGSNVNTPLLAHPIHFTVRRPP